MGSSVLLGCFVLFSSAYLYLLKILTKQEQKHQTEELKTVMHLSLLWFGANEKSKKRRKGGVSFKVMQYKLFPGLFSQASLVSQSSWLLFLCVKVYLLKHGLGYV